MPGKSRAQQAIEAERVPPVCQRLGIDPTRYHQALNRRAADYALLGASNEEIADLLGVHRASFEQWIVEKPALARALTRARVDANVRVVKAMHRAARGYYVKATKTKKGKRGQVIETIEETRHVAPSVPAATLILTNRASKHWRDAKMVEHSGQVDLLALVGDALPVPGAGAKVIEAAPVEVVGPTSPSVDGET